MEIDGKKFALGFGIAWVIGLLVSLGFLGLLAWAIYRFVIKFAS